MVQTLTRAFPAYHWETELRPAQSIPKFRTLTGYINRQCPRKFKSLFSECLDLSSVLSANVFTPEKKLQYSLSVCDEVSAELLLCFLWEVSFVIWNVVCLLLQWAIQLFSNIKPWPAICLGDSCFLCTSLVCTDPLVCWPEWAETLVNHFISSPISRHICVEHTSFCFWVCQAL